MSFVGGGAEAGSSVPDRKTPRYAGSSDGKVPHPYHTSISGGESRCPEIIEDRTDRVQDVQPVQQIGGKCFNVV